MPRPPGNTDHSISGDLSRRSSSDPRVPMDVEAWRDLQLLEAVEQESSVTQRTLSARLGIALGLTNLYLKRLIHKGYIKCVTMRPNRFVYSITPRGATRKARLTLEFMKYSLDLYRDARRHLRRGLDLQLSDRKRVAIYGTGEAAELAFLLLREIGVDPVATFDVTAGARFLGMPVQRIDEHPHVNYDVLIVAVLDKTHLIVNRLLAAGVPAEKLLLLRNETPKGNGDGTRKRGATGASSSAAASGS